MEVITVYGKKAASFSAGGDIKSKTSSRSVPSAGRPSRLVSSGDYPSGYSYGVNGYSPKKSSRTARGSGKSLFSGVSSALNSVMFSLHSLVNKDTIKGYRVQESRQPNFDYVFSGYSGGEPPSRRPSPKKDGADSGVDLNLVALRILHFFAFGSVCLFVPYFIFSYLNKMVDHRDFTGMNEWSATSLVVPQVTEVDSDSGEVVTRDLETLESLFGSKVADAEDSLAFSFNQNDAVFDNDGNLILENGEAAPLETYTVVEPVTFSTYKVRSGETIESITSKFGLRTISTLIALNDIKNVRSIKAGQKLTVPSMDGIFHSVVSGDSLLSLSVKYHIPMEDILDVNDISSSILSIGQKIFIPGAKLDIETLRDAMGETFKSPISVRWRLTSHFGPRKDPISGLASNHTGIDMACPKGTPIKAAMSGSVLKAGWSNIYGNYVVIKHPSGYQTLYGHMTRYSVKQGQSVDQGTCIGYVGSTGYSTGPHLHFTVYKNGKRIDPLPLIKK
ncbi:MAG: M23 family metallopeptidase [Treponema sp.]|nr:M23 family metallopeptidase [Treponema sp.]